jgi:hypothetical protein
MLPRAAPCLSSDIDILAGKAPKTVKRHNLHLRVAPAKTRLISRGRGAAIVCIRIRGPTLWVRPHLRGSWATHRCAVLFKPNPNLLRKRGVHILIDRRKTVAVPPSNLLSGLPGLNLGYSAMYRAKPSPCASRPRGVAGRPPYQGTPEIGPTI